MCVELMLVETIQSWAETTFPGDAEAAEEAVGIALRSYAEGAGLAESCEQTHRLMASWSRHPSRPDGQVRMLSNTF